MTDKRQVIYDIERCISNVPDACRDCSHYTGTVGFGCMENLMSDALALLKDQKAVEPIEIIDEKYPVGDSNRYKGYRCGKCKEVIPWDANYCLYCGRKVKWDD